MTEPVPAEDMSALEAYILWRAIAHAEDQEWIANELAVALLPLWQIMRFEELDRSTGPWLSSVLPVVKTAYLQSQRVTAVYAEDVRFAAEAWAEPLAMELPPVEVPANVPLSRFLGSDVPTRREAARSSSTEPVFVQFDPFPIEDAADSLVVEAVSKVKKRMPGPEADLMYGGLKNSAGAAIRHAMNGGRNATGRVVFADRRVIGYSRFTDGDPCWFCALLASRGAVFKVDSFHEGGRVSPWTGGLTKSSDKFIAPKGAFPLPDSFSTVARVHNHCRCTLRPVYASEKTFGRRYEPQRDREAQFYYDQWERVSKEWHWLSNKQIAAKFREQYQTYDRMAPARESVVAELESRRDALSNNGFAPFTPQAEWVAGQLNALA